MQLRSAQLLFAFFIAVIGGAITPAHAQLAQLLMPEVALKSGESVDLGDLSWTNNCKTFLKGTPQVEILDGPPGVTAAVKEKMVLPRMAQCSKRVKGGNLSLTVGDISEESVSSLRLRLKYETLEGRRDRNISVRVVLVPSD